MRPYPPIDADGHITESAAQIVPYIQDPLHAARQRYYPSDGWDRSLGGTLGTSASTAEEWTRQLDQNELDLTVLYPTEGLGIGCVHEIEVACAICRGYNSFFVEEFTKRDPRLLGAALIPMQDVDEAVKEVRRAVTELGMPGIMLPAVGLRVPLGDAMYHPIYAEAERLDVMVGVHATVREPGTYGAGAFNNFIEVHQLSHPFAQMQQMTSMMFQGVFEKFPRLRVAFMEAGCTWVPFWLDRMDTEWDMRGEIEAPVCKRRPSDYVQDGNIFFHAEEDERLIPAVAATLREDILYYASDFPHWDHHFPHSIDEFEERLDLSESLRKWILRDTALRLYGRATVAS